MLQKFEKGNQTHFVWTQKDQIFVGTLFAIYDPDLNTCKTKKNK